MIAPSVLSADFANLAGELRRLARAGSRWIHLDVMDNHFVPNLTFGPPVIAAMRPVDKRLFFDAHLMVTHPMKLVDALAAAGVQCVTVHQEALGADLGDALRTIRGMGMRTGVSVKPGTPVSAIEPVLAAGLADLVLVMTVEPGFGGQPMIARCLGKVRALDRARKKSGAGFVIQVDGGVDLSTAGLAASSGADVVVAGSAVFRGGDVAANLSALAAAAAAGA